MTETRPEDYTFSKSNNISPCGKGNDTMIAEQRVLPLIQTMLAPAVMISCCGLLLLTIVPKLGRIIDRIRLLNAEKIRLTENPGRDEAERQRTESLDYQTRMLTHRAELLKHSSGMLLLAILFFVVTSILLGGSFLAGADMASLILLAFLFGLVSVLGGVGFAYWEIRISHSTIVEEIETTKEIVRTLTTGS